MKVAGASQWNRKSFLAATLLGLVATLAPASELVQSPAHGYTVEVPAGWQHRFDDDGESLLLGAPGGFRVRLEVQPRGVELGRDDLQAAYKRDGRSLMARYQRLKVLLRPTRAGKLGSSPAFAYHFAYRDLDATVMEVRTWLASGSAREAGLQLHARVRAYGDRRLFPRYEDQLSAIVASFRFPAPAPSEATPTLLADGSGVTVLALAEPAPLPGGAPAGAFESATMVAADATRPAGELPPRSVPRPVYGTEEAASRQTFLAAFGIKQPAPAETTRRQAAASLGFLVPP